MLTAGVLLSVASLSACVEADVSDAEAGLVAPRTSVEASRAEEVEALLPGAWMWEHGSADAVDLSIVFLGHDAVSGDVALLIEGEDDEQVAPASVRLQGSSAELVTAGEGVWRIEVLGNDRLVLVDAASGATAHFHRMP